ncbi:MAG: phosphohydrolase, partial [Bacteroidota bacterium]
LASLCKMILNRNLLHIKMKNNPIPDLKFQEKLQQIMDERNLSEEDASYFVFRGEVANKAYHDSYQTIDILKKNGKVTHLLKESDQLSLKALSKKVTKYYICYPR